MRNNYEENQIFLCSLKLKYSFQEGFSRKKKGNKLMEKKSRHSGHCFGHNRGCHASAKFRTRKKGRKINYESMSVYENFLENILEDESTEIKKTRTTKTMLSQYELMGDFCIDIPEELLIEILSKSPFKTLSRFKCVSKLWRCLISNNVHVTNAPKLLIFAISRGEKVSFNSVDNEARVKSVSSPIEENLFQNHTVMAHSSCHGLLLMQIDKDLFIWNPLENFFRKVLTIIELNYQKDECRFEMNLCYCSANEEYKVVLVVNKLSNYPETQDFYVATCGAKSWKTIENVDLENMIGGPFFKGYRHWSCSSRTQVVYFDPSTNKFIEVAMPQRKESRKDNFLNLGVFDECLCITLWGEPEKYESEIELVVMKEYGNGNSREVIFVFSTSIEFRYYASMLPLFRTKEGEVVVGVYEKCNCCYSVEAYDAHGTFLRRIWGWSNSDLLCHSNFNVILYEESWRSPTI